MTDTPYLTRAREWMAKWGFLHSEKIPADLAALLMQADEAGFLRGYATALEELGLAKGLTNTLNARSLKEPRQ